MTRGSGKGGCEKKMLEAASLSSYVRINVEWEHERIRGKHVSYI